MTAIWSEKGENIMNEEWMPHVPMKRIICHWTAGDYTASDFDRRFYHFLIDGEPSLVRGFHSITANVDTRDGDYAAHTLNCNQGSIGISVCAMGGAVESPYNPGKWPIKASQLDMLYKDVAVLATFYRIPVTPQTILTHAEVQRNLGIIQRGKWDISHVSTSLATAKDFGDNMRSIVTNIMKGN